jgi:hypothetical protein
MRRNGRRRSTSTSSAPGRKTNDALDANAKWVAVLELAESGDIDNSFIDNWLKDSRLTSPCPSRPRWSDTRGAKPNPALSPKRNHEAIL